MSLGNAAFTQLFATTLQKYERELADNVLLTHPTLELFKENAKSYTGRGLVIPVRAATLSGTAYSDASGAHSTAVSNDLVGAAVFDWSNEIITPFRVKHREILQNSGPEQVVNLVEEYVKGATGSHQDFVVAELWAPNSSTGDLLSLQELVDDTIAVGGIDPTDPGKSYWASTVKVIPVTGPGSKDILAAFREVVNAIYATSRKRPTHIVAGFDVYEEFEAFLQDKGRYDFGSVNKAETRFREIMFDGVTVRLDPDCPVDQAYFLHAPALRFGYLAGEFMKTYPGDTIQGTLDEVVPIASTLSVGTTERRAHGKLTRTTSGS